MNMHRSCVMQVYMSKGSCEVLFRWLKNWEEFENQNFTNSPTEWLTINSQIPSYFIRLGFNYIYSRSNTLRSLSWTPHLKITMTTLFAWPNFKCFLCSTSVKQAHAISRVIIKGFSTIEPDDGCKDQGHAQYRWHLIQVRLYMLSLVFNTFKMVAYIVYNHPCW